MAKSKGAEPMKVSPDLGRKVDFRITDEEYTVLRIAALKKEMTVSRFLRAIVTACVAPTLLTTTEEDRRKMLSYLEEKRAKGEIKTQ